MKPSFANSGRILTALSLGTALYLTPISTQAGPLDFLKDRLREKLDDDRRDHEHRGRDDHDDRHRHYGRDRDRDHDHDHRYRAYASHPRSSFVISFGTGYAGQGYYYGPPNATYYYQTPGVTYYRSRESVPREYRPRSWQPASTDATVQRALARHGYYNGPIDGDLGPGTRHAISRFQRDRGLPVTGSVTPSLLRSLGL